MEDLKKEVYLDDGLKDGTITISTRPQKDSNNKIDPNFYNLVKSVTKKYSSALRELADR